MVLSRLPVVIGALLLSLLAVAAVIGWTRDNRQTRDTDVYVALGASDAIGIGAQRPGRDGWVALVHQQLPGDPHLLNLGISGARMRDVLSMQVPVTVDAQPEWVSLWPGINDLRNDVPLQTFRQQLDEALKELAAVKDTIVVVLTIPDLRALPAFEAEDPELLDATVQEWNGVIRDASSRHGALLVDLYSAAPELAENPQYVSADGFHPSSAGYRRIADMVIQTLEQHRALVSS